MDIKYYLQRNLLSKKEDAYAAHISTTGILDNKGLIRQMTRKGTTFSEAEIGAFMVLLNETVQEELSKGQIVKLPFVTLRLSIGGVFDGLKDRFNRNIHRIKVSASPSLELKRFAAALPVERVSKDVGAPVLNTIVNVFTDTKNAVLSPGNIARIHGVDLKFRAENASQGVFFVSEDGQQQVKVEKLESHSDSKIVFNIPDLPSSVFWKIEVRKAYGRTGSIIRTGQLENLLQVIPTNP